MLLRKLSLLALLLSGTAYADVIKTIQVNATDQTVTMKVIDAATGVPSTDLAYNSSGIDLEYWRHGANAVVDITEATQTVNGAHSDGGFVHIGAGQYRLDLPDAAVASGATAVEVYGVITGEIVIGGTVQLVAYNPHDAVRLGLTALPNANADAAGGLPISDAGGLDLDAHAALLVTVEGQTDDIGAAGAGLTTLSTQSSVNTLDTLLDALTAALGVSLQAGSNGAYPAMGIVASGTAQDYTPGTPSVTLASSTAVGDNDLQDTTILVLGSNEGDWQAASIESNVGSTDVVTINAAFSTEPTGTISYIIFGTAAGSAGGGLDAAGVRAAVGLASANLDTQLSTIEGQTDDIGAAGAGLTEAGGTGDQLTAVPWNVAWDAQVESEVDDALGGGTGTALTAVPWNSSWDTEVESEANDALVAIHLDHLLAVDYDPASQPGTATALLNELIESDSGVSRFTVNALENGPSGSGASAASIADAVWDELQADHTTVGTFGVVASEIADVLVDTAEIGAAGAGLTAVPWNASWDTEVQSEATDALNAYDPPTLAEVASEIADALATDTYAEPGAGAPAATASLSAKINYLYKAWRNRSTQTATTYTLYNDDGTTAAQESTVSDDLTTFVRGEVVSP